MRLMVFFDLPVETDRQRREYGRFRGFLLNDGYVMVQKSVYTRMALDVRAADAAVARLKAQKPREGLVQVMKVTEKQFAGMQVVSGEANGSGVIATSDRLVII